MATMQLTSTNPEWSFALKKNPNTGMIARTLRQGIIFGWFDNPLTYNIFFKENSDTSSFTKENNYLDITQYASTYPAFQCIAQLFNHLLSAKADDCEGEFSVLIPCVLTNARKLQYLSQFLGLSIQLTELKQSVFVGQNIFEFKCTGTDNSLKTFLMKLFVLFYLDQASGFNGVIFYPELTKKVAKILRELDAEYMLRYYLSKTAIKSEVLFNEVKDDLSHSINHDLQLYFGNTQTQRENAITQLFNFDKSIVDIGCGEGNYTIPFAKRLKKLNDALHVNAIDIDSEILDSVQEKADTRSLDNVNLFLTLDNFLKEKYNHEVVDVLLTEVIEHMPLEYSTILINQVLENIQFDTFVITTPNAEFNQFYRLDGFRHPDHHWEMSQSEFIAYMNSFDLTKYDLEFVNIGDSVNGIATSQGLIIKRKV